MFKLELKEEQTVKDFCPFTALSFTATEFKSVQQLMDGTAANESWICPHLTVSVTISNDGSLANTINTGAEENKIPTE